MYLDSGDGYCKPYDFLDDGGWQDLLLKYFSHAHHSRDVSTRMCLTKDRPVSLDILWLQKAETSKGNISNAKGFLYFW